MLSIGGTFETDTSYRYKRPDPELKTSNAKGGETIIKNTLDICKALNRDASIIISYIKKNGCPASIQKKKGCDDEIKINTVMSKEDINKYIEDLINDLVICKKCGNPETVIEFHLNSGDSDLDTGSYLRCAACGSLDKPKTDSKTGKEIWEKIEKERMKENKQKKKSKKRQKLIKD